MKVQADRLKALLNVNKALRKKRVEGKKKPDTDKTKDNNNLEKFYRDY